MPCACPGQRPLDYGLGPAIAVGQNLLNRNPLDAGDGLRAAPFLRLLYANFGQRPARAAAGCSR